MLRTSLAAVIAALLLTGPASAQPRKEAAAKGWGSLSGRVTLDGPVPTVVSLENDMKAHADKNCCLAGTAAEKIDRTWVVDPKTKGVANVVIWLKPKTGEYLPVAKDDRTSKRVVEIDQPFCAFMPYVAAHFPSYYDGANLVPTGETFTVKNSAPINHNVRMTGDESAGNSGLNVVLAAGKSLPVKLKPQRLPVLVNCDYHKWMRARVFVFENPYFAITKEDGSFEIPRVPAGAELVIMAMHETGYALDGKAGRTLTLKEGKNTLDFSVKFK